MRNNWPISAQSDCYSFIASSWPVQVLLEVIGPFSYLYNTKNKFLFRVYDSEAANYAYACVWIAIALQDGGILSHFPLYTEYV